MVITSAILLVIGSSLGWAALDLARKVLADRMRPVPLLFLMTSLATPIFLFWVVASGAPRPWVHGAGYWTPALASVALNVVANLLYLRAVTVSPFSQMVPLLAMTPMFATLAAIPLLGEVPGPRQWAGIALVTAGAFALQVPAGERRGGLASWSRAFVAEPGAPMMAGVALLWALATALDKAAIAHSEGLFHGVVLNGAVALAIAPWLMASGGLRELRRFPVVALPLVAALLVGVLALGLQLKALGELPVSLVETLKRGLGCLLALAVGRVAFRERVTTAKVAAVTGMICGVALILI
jgi:drug/metabolite transporter (DMT)-like permease